MYTRCKENISGVIVVHGLKLPRIFLTALLSLPFLAGCSTVVVEERRLENIWPPPPDFPRFKYELSLRSEKSVAKHTTASKFQDALVVGSETPKVSFVKPFDVAARNGRIMISDTSAGLVYLYNVPMGRLFGLGQSGEGKLSKPLGVSIDDANNLYVVDRSSKRVNVYSEIGHFLKSIGNEDDFTQPSDVAATKDGSKIYVIDTGGIDTMDHKVVVYSSEGEKLFEFGERGHDEGKLNLPTHIDIAPDGNIYILDAGNFRVQVYTPEGKYLHGWGGVGSGFGQFARPRGIAVDDEGLIYVTDARFGNFQIFNKKGQLLLAIGRFDIEDAPGHYALAAGISVDETGRIYVVDQRFKKVEVIKRLSKEEGEKLMDEYKEFYDGAEGVALPVPVIEK